MSPPLPSEQIFSAEIESVLVAACRRPELRGAEFARFEHLAAHGTLPRLLEAAGEHGVLGLTLSSLLPASCDDADQPQTDLSRRIHDLRLRSSTLELKCNWVVVRLETAGISPVVLKGAAIALLDFPEPWQRDLADLDLLVRPQDVEAAIDALKACGYRSAFTEERNEEFRRHHFHLPLTHPDGHYVEIHWALTRPDSPFRLDPDRVYWSATRLVTETGTVMRVPRPEHMLLHIVIQNLQEGFSRLGRTVDIDRIIAATDDFDWDFLATEAQLGKLESATSLSLQLAARLMGTPVPAEIHRALLPPPVSRFHLALLRPEDHLLTRRVTRIRAAEDLLEFWLLDVARRRSGTVFHRHGIWHGTARITKVAVLQLFFYARALFPSGNRSPRTFWSAPAPDQLTR